MVKCAKCGEKIGVFQEKYDYKDEDGNPVKYCSKCNENWEKLHEEKERKRKLKEEEEQKKDELKIEEKKSEKERKLLENLQNDPLITKFCEQESSLALSLSINNFEGLNKGTDFNTGTGTSYPGGHNEYIKFSECIMAENLSGFMGIFNCDIELINLYFSKDSRYTYWGLFDKNPKIKFIATDFLQFFKTESIEKFSKLLQIILQRYGDVKVSVLFGVLNKKAKEHMTKLTEEVCAEFGTKERIFAFIMEHGGEAFLEGTARFYLIENMQILFDCMKKKGLVECDSIEMFKVEMYKWKKSIELREFENGLLNPNIPKYSIEDLDVMNGFEFESFLIKLFSNMGYKVEQTKLSGDQGADLIIERNKNKTVVQAKCYSGKISNKAVQEVVASIKYYKASDGIIVTNSYFTPSAIKLADSNQVRLIDRNKLKELIKKYLNSDSNDYDLKVQTETTFNLDNNTIEAKCPKCKFDFIYTLNPNEENFETICPECKSKIGCSLTDRLICPHCDEKFSTIKDIKKHVKLCKTHKNSK